MIKQIKNWYWPYPSLTRLSDIIKTAGGFVDYGYGICFKWAFTVGVFSAFIPVFVQATASIPALIVTLIFLPLLLMAALMFIITALIAFAAVFHHQAILHHGSDANEVAQWPQMQNNED